MKYKHHKKYEENTISMKRTFSILLTGFFVLIISACDDFAQDYADRNMDKLRNPYSGWNVLSDEYVKYKHLDGLTLEWDYFAVADKKGNFDGIIGLTINDPRGRLGDDDKWVIDGLVPKLQPSGGNVAVVGRFNDGTKFAEFLHFGLLNETTKTAGKNLRTFDCTMDDGSGYYTKQYPIPDGNGGYDGIKLEGESENIIFDLTVKPLWPERIAERGDAWRIGKDIGILEDEHFTVNIVWLTTEIKGTIIRKSTGEKINIDATGYREDSFGRYAFIAGGWDFGFLQDVKSGVGICFQSYHPNTTDLDYLHIDWEENGKLIFKEFRADEDQLTWIHDSWSWSYAAQLCHPDVTTLVAEDNEYLIEIDIEIYDEYIPLLSDTTIVTDAFVINEHMSWWRGTITKKSTGEVVKSFNKRGWSEFANARSFFKCSPGDWACTLFSRGIFQYQTP